MARWAPERRAVLEAIEEQLLHNYPRGRVIVAIDGRDGAGKTEFAKAFAEVLRHDGHETFIASLDDFHRPREARWARGRDSAAGCYADSYDYDALRRVLISPFRMAGSTGFSTAFFDVERDAPIVSSWQTAGPDAILLVEGVFANRPELAGSWNFSIWLEAPAEVTYDRMAARDGSDPDPEAHSNARYTDAQELYQAEVGPRTKATVIVNNTDWEHPRQVFADSC